jgi:hypothetical protein
MSNGFGWGLASVPGERALQGGWGVVLAGRLMSGGWGAFWGIGLRSEFYEGAAVHCSLLIHNCSFAIWAHPAFGGSGFALQFATLRVAPLRKFRCNPLRKGQADDWELRVARAIRLWD